MEREEAERLGIVGVGRLVLNDGVQLLEEAEIVGMNGIELPSGEVDELLRGRIAGLRQRIAAEPALDRLVAAAMSPSFTKARKKPPLRQVRVRTSNAPCGSSPL